MNRLFTFLRDLWRIFRDNHGPQHAGAIAYFGLLSIIPFSVLIVAIMALVMAGIGIESSSEQLALGMTEGVPFLSEDVRQELVAIASAGKGLSIVSGMLLLLSASSVFTSLNRGVNAVLGTEVRQRYLVTRLLSALLIIAFATSLFLWQITLAWIDGLLVSSSLRSWYIQGAARWACETLLFGVGFFAVVRLVSKARYRKRFYWAGALAFVALSGSARVGLDVYFARAWKLRELYGGLAAIMGLVLWVYVVSVILLLSCALVRVLAERTQTLANARTDRSPHSQKPI